MNLTAVSSVQFNVSTAIYDTDGHFAPTAEKSISRWRILPQGKSLIFPKSTHTRLPSTEVWLVNLTILVSTANFLRNY